MAIAIRLLHHLQPKKERDWTRSISLKSPYLQRLRESGFTLNDDQSVPIALDWWVRRIQYSSIRWSSVPIETMLRTLLDLGVDMSAADHDSDSLLYHMLIRTAHERSKLSFHNTLGVAAAYDRNETLSYNTLELATALLKNGADPYALNRYGYSIFDNAEHDGHTPILLQSLERAGYNFDEVRDEVRRRQWCFRNPDHGFAESTAVEGAHVGSPSAKGLIPRKGVRGDRLED